MKSDIENKDWLNEFTALQQVDPKNPFTVPSGYFSDLTGRIVSLKNLHELNTGQAAGFSIPENYFNELSGNIQSRIAISGAISVENTSFKVPENYFDELSSNIQSRIAIEEAAVTDGEFVVPQGYFENLQQQITARIAVEEAINTTEETFAVPAGYFDKLNAAILSKTVEAEEEVVVEETKVVTMQRRGITRMLFTSGIYKYAAAACVTVVIGVTFLLNNKPEATTQVHDGSYLHTHLLSIPVYEIKNYVEQNMDAGDTQTMLNENQAKGANLSDDEILDYIDTEI